MKTTRAWTAIVMAVTALWLTVSVVALAQDRPTTRPASPEPAAPKPRAEDQGTPRSTPTVAQTLRKMAARIDKVDIQDATAEAAFKWWADTVGVKLLIDWEKMVAEGIDPQTKITLNLTQVPAGTVLGMLMNRASPDVDLIYEITPWYIQIMTKRQANKVNVTRVYDVGDIVHDPAVGRPAMTLNLNPWTPNSAMGAPLTGGTGASRDRLWPTAKTNQQSGEELCHLIRQWIEPAVWVESGGTASVRFLRNSLIVHAPEYVHAQIDRDPKEGRRPIVFLSKAKAEMTPAPPPPPPVSAGLTQSQETQTTGISVGVGVTTGSGR